MAISSVGTNARDYIDVDAWLASLPATLLEQEVAELYNDSEFVITSSITVSGITTTPTFNIVIRAAVGQAFNDTEQALRYNAANGVGIRKSTSYQNVINLANNNVLIQNIQFATGTLNTIAYGSSISNSNHQLENCLFDSGSHLVGMGIASANTTMTNIVLHMNEGSTVSTPAIRFDYSSPSVHNLTILNSVPSSTATAITKGGNVSPLLKNSAIFGFALPVQAGINWAAGTGYNATDNATLTAGTNNQVSLVTADQFENTVSSATLDLRLKSGNSLDGSGTPDSAFNNDLDIFNNARSLTAPSIGAYEAVASSGISIVGDTANYNYAGIVGSVDLTGEVIVTGSTGSYNYTGITATIELGAEIIVTGQAANYNYTGIDGSVELTGLITVLGQTANYDYNGIAADITLQGSIIVSGSTANYDYNALNATIILQGPITINPKNIVRVKRQLNTIRVKRNSNIIRVR